jgi:hypothetical protein
MAWDRKLIISAVVMFVMAWALSFVVHGWLLSADYSVTPGMRSPAEAQSIIGAAFAWVYAQGKEDRPWLAQGVRFGIAIALLTAIPTYLIYHVVTPVPLALAIKQIVYDTIRIVLMGIAVAWLNR